MYLQIFPINLSFLLQKKKLPVKNKQLSNIQKDFSYVWSYESTNTR